MTVELTLKKIYLQDFAGENLHQHVPPLYVHQQLIADNLEIQRLLLHA